MTTYDLRDSEGGSDTIEAADLRDAQRQARRWARGGDYGDVESTIWVDVYIYEADEHVETVTVAIDPQSPACADGRSTHEWTAPHGIVGGLEENPGVWGHGGGVTMHRVCPHCGTHRHVDTWAQRPDTGEQGLTSTRYTDDDLGLSPDC